MERWQGYYLFISIKSVYMCICYLLMKQLSVNGGGVEQAVLLLVVTGGPGSIIHIYPLYTD